jgi:hypothetical protein
MKSETRERPILFNGEMVRAILDGRKTQTRRVIRPQPPEWCRLADIEGPELYTPARVGASGEIEPADREVYGVYDVDGEWGAVFPYGRPWDRLWVREAFNPHYGGYKKPAYRADWEKTPPDPDLVPEPKWKPSIHMPRWASRIDLEIIKIEIQRIQNIEEREVWAEGVKRPDWWDDLDPHIDPETAAREKYARVWDKIYAKRGYTWSSNPWVWVITFRVIRPMAGEWEG